MGDLIVDIIRVLDGEIEENVRVKEIFSYEIFTEDAELYNIKLVFDADGGLHGFVIVDNMLDILQNIVVNMRIRNLNIPTNIIEYRKKNPQVRDAQMTWGPAGGNASKNSISNKITIPNQWLREMGVNEFDRAVRIEYSGEKIIIEKK